MYNTQYEKALETFTAQPAHRTNCMFNKHKTSLTL